MFSHKTIDNMALLQIWIRQGISFIFNTKVIKVERSDEQLTFITMNSLFRSQANFVDVSRSM